MTRMATIVDTNVAVVSNGKSAQASPECVLTCIERLLRVTNESEKLTLDDQWHIIGEYSTNLQPTGQPGVGDAFLKWVLTNWRNPNCCDLVTIHDDENKGYEEFPADPDLADFDPSDRKFVAVSVAHPERPPILQAVDSDWWRFRVALQRNGVEVDFLCSDDVQRLLT